MHCTSLSSGNKVDGSPLPISTEAVRGFHKFRGSATIYRKKDFLICFRIFYIESRLGISVFT